MGLNHLNKTKVETIGDFLKNIIFGIFFAGSSLFAAESPSVGDYATLEIQSTINGVTTIEVKTQRLVSIDDTTQTGVIEVTKEKEGITSVSTYSMPLTGIYSSEEDIVNCGKGKDAHLRFINTPAGDFKSCCTWSYVGYLDIEREVCVSTIPFGYIQVKSSSPTKKEVSTLKSLLKLNP